jgi:glycosyltransferase involved in cell wall biosynthesis
MNILLVAEDFILNGVTRHIVDLADGLVQSGHKVFVAATLSTQSNRLGSSITFIPLQLCYPDSYKKRYSGIIKSIKILLRTIKENHIEIIHTHKRYADVFGRIAARLSDVKHVSTCHNEFINYRRLSPFGDMTIAPCAEIAQMLTNDFGFDEKRIRIVFYGIKPFRKFDAELNRQRRQLFGIANDVKIILSVGHLSRQKDRPTLIKAINILHKKGDFEKAVCIIVGEGEEQSTVETLINKYHLENVIRLLPAISDIETLDNIADFCVLSSIHEAAPHVILEAASVSKPHVATSVGFIPSFIGNNHSGICVPPGDPIKLAEGIYYLLSNPCKVTELGAAAEEKFNQFYRYDDFIKNTLLVYEEILSTHK